MAKPEAISVGGPFHAIDHVQLAMPLGSEDAARSFYVGKLGLMEMPKPSELAERGGAWFRSGEVFIHLGVDSDFKAAKKAHPAFLCTDYYGLLRRLNAQGVQLTLDDIPVNGKAHCYISDPFGNRIELIAE